MQGTVLNFIGPIAVLATSITLATYSNKWNSAVELLAGDDVPVPQVLDVLNSSII